MPVQVPVVRPSTFTRMDRRTTQTIRPGNHSCSRTTFSCLYTVSSTIVNIKIVICGHENVVREKLSEFSGCCPFAIYACKLINLQK